jgi:serine/threonine-protein kinase RsbW
MQNINRHQSPTARTMKTMNGGLCSSRGGVPDKGGDFVTAGAGSSRTAFQQSYPAVPGSVGEVRAALKQFAREVGLPAGVIDDVELAASEAATNVVIHAYGDREVPGAIDVSATVAGDELWVIITDVGLGLRPRPDSPGLGLGLAIIAQLADGVDLVRPAVGGLELRMRFAMAREAA